MINDYKNWYLRKKHFIDHLKEHDSLIISRINNVIEVLNTIAEMKPEEIDGDYDLIFDCGYSYLYSTIDEVEIYLHKYFDDNLHQFMDYEPLINYALYVNELKATLVEQDSINMDADEEFDGVLDDIEDILRYKRPYLDSKLDEFDARLLSTFVFKKEHLTTPEIFNQIAEELEIIEDKKKFFSHTEKEQDNCCEHIHVPHDDEEDEENKDKEQYQNTVKIDL